MWHYTTECHSFDLPCCDSGPVWFPDTLYTEPVGEGMALLPSPEALKRKIIVKAKKQPAAEKADESESEEEEEAEKIAVDMKADIKQVRGLKL
jgi:hypothetical protein